MNGAGREKLPTYTRILVLLWAWGLQLLSTPSMSDEPVDIVRIAGAMYLGDIPTAVADHLGAFEKRGIQASVEYNPSGQQSLARLRAGEADFALMALTPFVLDHLADPTPGQPDDPVILASLVHSTELTQLLVRADAGVDKPADLAGKRVAVQCGTNTDFALWLFAQHHGLEPASIHKVCMPFGETPRALGAGKVDAAILPDPWTFEASLNDSEASSATLREFELSRIYTGTWVLVTSRHLADQNRALSSHVLGAYLDAIKAIERRPDEALEIYNRRENLPFPVTRQQWQMLDHELGLTWALLSGLRQQIRWARATGVMNEQGPVEILEMIDPRPLDKLQSNRVDIPHPTLEPPAQ